MLPESEENRFLVCEYYQDQIKNGNLISGDFLDSRSNPGIHFLDRVPIMASNSGTLDQWRSYFRTANSDIFGIIEHAILVAAFDCPTEFRLRRDRIAEKLFSCKLTRCFGCDRVELAVPENDGGRCKMEFDMDACEFEAGGSGSKENKDNSSTKESKANSIREDRGEMNMNQVSNYSYGEAEALTDEIEEETQIAGEVLRIREILENSEDEVYFLYCYYVILFF